MNVTSAALQTSAVAVLATVCFAFPAAAADEALLKGLVAGCIDREVAPLGREPTLDEKRNILNFCCCRAPGLAALIPDDASKQKLMLAEPQMMAAVKRVDDSCMVGVKSGRRFYP